MIKGKLSMIKKACDRLSMIKGAEKSMGLGAGNALACASSFCACVRP